MEFTPSYSQLLYLYALAFSGETPSARRPGLDGARRKPLEDAGLIRRSGEVVELTDSGFRFVENRLGMVPEDARRAGLAERAPLVMSTAIANYLKAQGLRLTDLLVPTAVQKTRPMTAGPVTTEVEPGATVVDTPEAPDKLSDAIHEAYLSCTRGTPGVRVHLSDLRKNLSFWDREEVDAALLGLYRDGRLRLERVEDPAAETPADQEAALMVYDNPRHFVAFLD
jgi:hypothetical protein